MTVATAPPGFDLSLCIPDLKSKKKEAAFAEIVAAASGAGLTSDEALLLELLKIRERLGNTGVGKGVALPHARSLTIAQPRILVARSSRGIDWAASDQIPVQLVLLSLAPAEWSDEAFHSLVAKAAAAARLQRTRQKLIAAPFEDLANTFRAALA
jgi:mannitol/fructose-specific phosphotransferase system IIA component (Ntr-type)